MISTSLDLPDKTLLFVREKPLMDEAVKPSSQQPLLVKKGAAFTRIVVASTTALDGSTHQVMFIGTGNHLIYILHHFIKIDTFSVTII